MNPWQRSRTDFLKRRQSSLKGMGKAHHSQRSLKTLVPPGQRKRSTQMIVFREGKKKKRSMRGGNQRSGTGGKMEKNPPQK